MKLSKSFFEKLYSILFWFYPEPLNVPNNLCPLFWTTLLALLTFIPFSILKGIGLVFNLPNWIFSNMNISIPQIPNFVKYISFGIFYIFGMSLFVWMIVYPTKPEFLNDVSNSLLMIWAICMLIDMFITSGVLMLLLFAFVIVPILEKISGTNKFQTLQNNIKISFDWFIGRYCPVIKWK